MIGLLLEPLRLLLHALLDLQYRRRVDLILAGKGNKVISKLDETPMLSVA